MLSSLLLDALSLAWKWVPVRVEIVDSTHHAIRWWMGKPTKAITHTGWQWYVPILGDISTHSIVPQVVESEVQLVGLACGTTLAVSIAVHYNVEDVMKWYHAVSDFDDSFLNLLQIAVTEVMATCTFDEWLDQDVMADLRKRFKILARRWGVKIHDINFVNSGKVRPLHITGISLGESE